MINASKLSLALDMSSFSEDKIKPHHKYGKLQKFARNLPGKNYGSETSSLENAKDFILQLPEQLLKVEIPSVFLLELPAVDVDDAVLPAHVDLNRVCGINVYLETNGETTTFYTWNPENRTSVYLEEFCAETGDCWLMDTTVPHAVNRVRNKRRRILTYSFVKTPYKKVLELL